MRNDFLTIPDAPNYEINSQLICRNKKTGYIMKLLHTRGGRAYYSLVIEKYKIIKRSPKTFRRTAEAAVTHDKFEPISSLDNRYEINLQGKVRNAATKRILKLKNDGKNYCFNIGGKFIWRSIADLLWEVHGRPKEYFWKCVPCIAENDTRKIFFPNMFACARFLAPKIFLTAGSVRFYLYQRKPIIYGWKITYLEDKHEANDFYLGKLGREAQRLKKLDKELGYEN